MADQAPSFMDLVQAHERAWGNTGYPNQPSLSDILQAPVVVFWQTLRPKDATRDRRYKITTHLSLSEIERHLSKILFRSHIAQPKQRIYRIYAHQKHIRIRGMRVLFDDVDDSLR